MVRPARAVAVAACAATFALPHARARADGLETVGGSPRSIGRAGAGTVSDDGGGALLLDPAGLARRETNRVQLGAGFSEDSLDWAHDNAAPKQGSLAGSSALPLVAIEGGLGGFVLGAAAMTSAVADRALRAPGLLPPESLGTAFDYRYAGLAGTLRKDTITIGAARRLGDAVAVGLAVAGSRVTVSESRALWASDLPSCTSGAVNCRTPGDPGYDVDVAMTAVDAFAPSAVAGVLVAPPDTHVELAASVAWAGRIHADGTLAATGPMPTTGAPGVTVTQVAPHASITLEQPLTLRTGARWLGSRWSAELNGDLWIYGGGAAAATWQTGGVHVTDQTTFADTELAQIASRISAHTHGAVRAAVDLEVIEGLLWVTAGYAFTTQGTAEAAMSPTFGTLASHTLGLGLEVAASGFTVTLGWSRTWDLRQIETTSEWRLDNPFGTSDGAVPPGIYDGSIDLAGISIDAEL